MHLCPSGSSSLGRARPCQGRGSGFEARLPLQSTSQKPVPCCDLLATRAVSEADLRAPQRAETATYAVEPLSSFGRPSGVPRRQRNHRTPHAQEFESVTRTTRVDPRLADSPNGSPRGACLHRVTITRERLPHTSTGRFLDKLADFFFDGGGESVHGKRGRPKVTVIEVRVLLETERRVP